MWWPDGSQCPHVQRLDNGPTTQGPQIDANRLVIGWIHPCRYTTASIHKCFHNRIIDKDVQSQGFFVSQPLETVDHITGSDMG
jgi:hypothetical protein